MLAIRIRDTGQVIGDAEFRRMNSNTSFPAELTDDILDAFGADQVFKGAEPQTSSPYQFVFEQGVEQIDGKWYTKQMVGPVFIDITNGDGAVITAGDQDSAYRAAKDADQAAAVRADRDRRLAECDWVVIKAYETNSNVPAAWEIYRQALRDVPAQAGFPWGITWPTKP